MITAMENRDRKRVVEIWAQSFGDSEEYINDFLDRSIADTFVYRENNTAVGMITLFEVSSTVNKITVKGGYVYALAVDKDYRGRKIAEKLLKYADRFLADRGCDFALVVPEPYKALEGYYRSMGYTEELPLYIEETETSNDNTEAKVCSADEHDYYRCRIQQDGAVIHGEQFFSYVYEDIKQSGAKMLNVKYEEFQGFCICYDKGDYVIIKEALPMCDINRISKAVVKAMGKSRAVCVSAKGEHKQPYGLLKKYKDCFEGELYANLLLDSFENRL